MNKKVETFLEHTNMNYMFCLLTNMEIQRLNNLPPYVKQKFPEKITELSMDHIAQNDIPDYIMDIEEARAEMERLGLTPEEYESGGRRENFDEEDVFDTELVSEDFQGEYTPTFTEEAEDEEDEEEESAADEDED